MAVGPGFLLFLVDDPLPSAEDFLLVGQGLQGMLVREVVNVGLADRFAGVLQANIAGHRLVDADEAALGILEVDVVRQVVHQRVQEVAFLLQVLVGGRQLGGAIADPPLQFRLRLAKFFLRLAEGAEQGSDSSQTGEKARGSQQLEGLQRQVECARIAVKGSIKQDAAVDCHQGNAACHEPPRPFSTSDPHYADG